MPNITRKVFRDLIFVTTLLVSLVIGMFYIDKKTGFFTRALGKKSDLVVDVGTSYAVSDSWRALAQGGEESGTRMISPVITQVKVLGPEYIRIDHVYDFYGVVSRDPSSAEAGGLVFDWSRLDMTVEDIIATGAKPFLSLSYMPTAISSGSEVDNPTNWSDWELVVQRTIEHFSRDKNISDVYYEVWNEPDLFGGYKTYGEKNYLNLYLHSVMGATRASGVKPFKIGGPATTALYENWVKSLLKFTRDNNLRIDFLSWHKYSKDLSAYEKDMEDLDKWLLDFPQYQDIELVVSEVGPNSDNDKVYDEYFGAIHTLATTALMQDRVGKIFTFEIKDGPQSQEKFWGRWGILTNEKFGTPEIKPRYSALQFLNRMKGQRINIAGEGSWVKAFGRVDGKTVRIFVVNYDDFGKNHEAVPITLVNLPSQKFTFRRINFGGVVKELPVASDSTASYSTIEYFDPNTAAIFEVVFE